MSLDSADVTTEGLNEVFGMVRDGFFSSDDAAEVWIGFVEGVDEGVVGTDGEMLADILVPDGDGEDCFGIMACATVVVVVLVVVGEGLGLGVVGLGVVVVVDVTAGVVGMAAAIAGFGTASVVVAFSIGVVCRLVVAIVVKLICKAAGSVVVDELEIEMLNSVGNSFVTLVEVLAPADWWETADLSVWFLPTWIESAKTKFGLVNGDIWLILWNT